MQQNEGIFLSNLIAQKKFTTFFSFILVLLTSVSSAWSAGYTCDSYKIYMSCNQGYFLTVNGVFDGTPVTGNACTECPADAAYCPGGQDAPFYQMTLTGGSNTSLKTVYYSSTLGWYLDVSAGVSSGNKITAMTDAQKPKRSGYEFSGYYSASSGGTQFSNETNFLTGSVVSGPMKLYAHWRTCSVGSYCTTDGVYACPDGFTTQVGASKITDCFLTCSAGTTLQDTTCTTLSGAWFTAAHRAHYGVRSPRYLPFYPFLNNTSTLAAYHNLGNYNISTYRVQYRGTTPAGHYIIGTNGYIQAYAVRIKHNYGNMSLVLDELTVVPQGTTIVTNSTSEYYGKYDPNLSVIVGASGTTSTPDLVNSDPMYATDMNENTLLDMGVGAEVTYVFPSAIPIVAVQISMPGTGGTNSIGIELDTTGDGNWVSITGNDADAYVFNSSLAQTIMFPAAAWVPCNSGTYRPAVSNVTWNLGLFTGCAACSSLADGFYTKTDSTASASSADCYGNTTAGNYIETPNSGLVTCAENGFCPAGAKVYYGSVGGMSSCPTDYPNSEAGSDQIIDCFSNTKSREWTGSQTTCVAPENSVSHSCNSCSISSCDYVAYANSLGIADGVIKSGCALNNAACQQTVAPSSLVCSVGYYTSDVLCSECTNKPENSSYTDTATSNTCPWECWEGYNQTVDGLCGQMCTIGVQYIKISNGLSLPLYKSKQTDHTLAVKTSGGICYASLASGTASNTLNIDIGGDSYHVTE